MRGEKKQNQAWVYCQILHTLIWMGAAIQIPGESLAMIYKRLLHNSLVPPGNCHLFSYHILAFYEHKRESILMVSDTGRQL